MYCFRVCRFLRADDVLVRKANSLANVTIITNALTTEVHGDGKRVTSLSYTDRAQMNRFVGISGDFCANRFNA